ncbi:MAG: hypothetical protein F2621_03200 [Actinobacteria bacterium]|nr:hypothetical protein [Actinomycetota bacterium]MTA32715.1 hypothetical protein [Actinomycetota bacterium]
MNRPGVHRTVVALYGVLSLAALGRSSYQILTKLDEAPLAYTLSGVAAAVYVLATVTVALSARPRSRAVALGAISFELIGVLGIGALSLIRPELFPDPTVWSQFGAGYVFVPLVLPIVGLWWLLRGSRS